MNDTRLEQANQRMNSYQIAKQFFSQNELYKEERDAESKIEMIQDIIKKVQNGDNGFYILFQLYL